MRCAPKNGIIKKETAKKQLPIHLTTIIVFALILCSCGGLQDWEYDLLPNNYEIWRINSEDIALVKNDGSICVINRYILVIEFERMIPL